MYPAQFDHSMGGLSTPYQQQPQSLKRARSHDRTPSASTIASSGPVSPFSFSVSQPQIANQDFAPQPGSTDFWDLSTGFPVDQSFSKYPLNNTTALDASQFFMTSPGYMPSQAAHTPNAQLAMKGFAIDHHNTGDMPTEVTHASSRQSSSVPQDSPATPRSTAGEDVESKVSKPEPSEGVRPHPNVQLQRTESAAYQDELYNPANFTSAPTTAPKANTQHLTPHRNLVNERLQTANNARSASPSSSNVSGERSPFRQGSPLAPAPGTQWNAPRPGVGTQAGMRRQQKEERAQAEYAQHRPTLQREPTKTISPKDAMLDYAEGEQPPLFQDTVPTGYKQHFGGTEQFPQNFFSQGNAFGGLPATANQPNINNFRASNPNDLIASGFDFSAPAVQPQNQLQPPFQPGQYQNANNGNGNAQVNYSMTEQTPDFPTHLTSMESSMSEGNTVPSSQETSGANAAANFAVQRPDDTRAATGTYTCTYHGCTQRFESQPALQRHKRDYHRSQAHNHHRDLSASAASVAASLSPSAAGSIAPSTSATPSSPGDRSTSSPDPNAPEGDPEGITSAALLERNSQAGPHKCSRINPSTGKPCNTVFSRPYDLTRHEDTIHNNRKQKVRCPYCREEKTFSRNDALTRHMRVVHPEVDGWGKRSGRG